MDTPAAKQRRTLHFTSIDEITRDAEKLAIAERKGHLRQVGTWTLGQACNHLATWINYGFDGTPARIPLIIRLFARPLRRRFIYKPMHPGGRLPKVPGGTLALEVLPTDEGLARLRLACNRLKADVPKIPNPVFGKLKPDEWRNLHMRHAELHLSFLRTD
jgi:EAL domain-containing protein (putative c-di-GMP-specific phosphodiesterase class I)